MTLLRRALLLSCLSFAPGCITYTNDQLPARSYSEIQPRRGRPAVAYTLEVGPVIGPENPKNLELFSERVEAVFARSEAFTSVKKGAGSSPCAVRLALNHRRDLNEGFVLLFACSLTLLPAYAENHWTLEASVERRGQVVKTYRYEDSTSSWFQTFLVFGYPFKSPEAAATKIFDNMLLNFLKDAFEDGSLAEEAGVLGPAPASHEEARPDSTAPAPNAPAPNAPAPNAPAATKDDR